MGVQRTNPPQMYTPPGLVSVLPKFVPPFSHVQASKICFSSPFSFPLVAFVVCLTIILSLLHTIRISNVHAI